MPVYEFTCRGCGAATYTDTNRLEEPSACCGAAWKRVWGFQMVKVMHSHFNPTTGTMVSDRKQFRSELDRLSDEQTKRTGFPARYVEADHSDTTKLGVTDAGLDTTYDRKVRTGEIDKGTKAWL